MDWSVLSLPQWQSYVRSVSERAGLALEWSDDGSASTNGKRMWLPRPGMNLGHQEAMDLLSLAIHETSHVQHTDMDLALGVAEKDPSLFKFFNIIEDDRIEAIPAKEWPGDMVAFKVAAPGRVERFIRHKIEHLKVLEGAARSAEAKYLAAATWDCELRAEWAPEYMPAKATLDALPIDVIEHIETLKRSGIDKAMEASRYDATMAGSAAYMDAAREIKRTLKFTDAEEKEAQAEGIGAGGAGADGGDHEAMVAGKEHALPTNEEADDDAPPSGVAPKRNDTSEYFPVDPHDWIIKNAEDLVGMSRSSSVPRIEEPASLRGVASQVRRLLQIASQTLRTYGHKTGHKLRGSALYRVPMKIEGFSERVFARKETQLDLDVAVFVLVDASGSMAGAKIGNAILAASELSDVIGNVIGVPVMVGMFTTAGRDGMGSAKSPLHVIARKFRERTVPKAKIIERMEHAAARMLRANMDGEAVTWAARELLGTRAKRRILLVLSDGSPAANVPGDMDAYLKQCVIQSEKHGIEVFGIGIEDNDVAKFYPKHVVLTNASELGKLVVNLVGQRILKGVR